MAETEAEDPGVELDLKERAMDEAPVGITISDPDREDNPLIYANEAFERLTGYPRDAAIGDNCRFLQGEDSDPEGIAAMRTAVEEGKPVSVELVNYRRDGEPFWNEVTIAPLTDADGRITHFVGFQDDVTARKEAELAVERERRNLDHLLARIQGLVSDVTRALVEAESRDGVEQGVVERVVETESYALAWVGEPDGASVVPRAWAGDPGVEVDQLTVEREDRTHPTARAVESHEVEVDERGEDGSDRFPELDAEFDGVAAVPLTYGETLYGVLTVCAVRPDALDEREVTVLEALGRAIGTALNALESRRILSTDSLVELEFEVRDRGLFVVDLSARCECRLDYEGAVHGADGGFSMFFTTDTDPGTLIERAAEVPGIARAARVGGGGEEHLVEFDVEAGSFVVDLAERGVRTRSIAAEDGSARIQIEFPTEADSRAIADRFRERYAETELVAYRERERPPTTRREFIEALEGRLTERQQTALRKAYLGGYYDATRTTSGDELADSMDISRSTFHQHLRAAERKLVGEFLDR